MKLVSAVERLLKFITVQKIYAMYITKLCKSDCVSLQYSRVLIRARGSTGTSRLTSPPPLYPMLLLALDRKE